MLARSPKRAASLSRTLTSPIPPGAIMIHIVLRGTGTIVSHGQDQLPFCLSRADVDENRTVGLRNAVLDRVFDERLEDQPGHCGTGKLFRQVDSHLQPLWKSARTASISR